jgi:hypothetical protein
MQKRVVCARSNARFNAVSASSLAKPSFRLAEIASSVNLTRRTFRWPITSARNLNTAVHYAKSRQTLLYRELQLKLPVRAFRDETLHSGPRIQVASARYRPPEGSARQIDRTRYLRQSE